MTRPEAEDFELTFDTLEELLKAWARVVSHGALFVPGLELEDSTSFLVTFAAAGRRYAGQRATPIDAPRPSGSQGTWLKLEPSDELRTLVASQLEAGRALPPGGRRAQARYATALQVFFERLPELAERWATDISRGGLFVRHSEPPAVGSKLMVTLVLPDGQRTSLWAEVAHQIPHGPDAGCGLRFVDTNLDALKPVETLVSAYHQRRPQVLLIDDEPAWSTLVAEGLRVLGVDVEVLADPAEGQRRLTERFFELDLLVVNVRLPGLDAVALLHRVSEHGHARGLRVILCSAATPEELALAPQDLGKQVISKHDNLGKVIARARLELNLYDQL